MINNEHQTLNRYFEVQAKKNPDRIAVVDGAGGVFTYNELNKRADQWAQQLKKRGVEPDTIVALEADPSSAGMDSIIGILAILKAGGAYLPIDRNYPQERIDFMLADSQSKSPLERGARRAGCVGLQPTATNLAYVIFTSGSTGTPKGVLVEHRNVVNLVKGLEEKIYKKYSGKLNIALVAPLVFDGSVKQVFGALLQGHTLFMVPGDARADGVRLVEYYNKFGIDISDGSPAHLRLMSDAGEVPGVKHFLIGGEVLPKPVVEVFFEKFAGTFTPVITNVYGPTECCVDSAAFDITRENIVDLTVIPIGKPLLNQQVYIEGEQGELYVGGGNVSRGYLNRPELTAERFNKTYKTGDLCRRLDDGNIEFLGRLDHQVKIRGFRVELGEIESRLLKHHEVKEAVVITREDKHGDKYLCAYVVPQSPHSTNYREYLSRTLPGHMVPSFFVSLERLPLNPSGKVDRQALPEPRFTGGADYAAPRSALEDRLLEIWSGALGLSGAVIGIDDHFFEMGGHSLSAAAVTAQVHKTFHLRLSLAEMFRHPTVRQAARYLGRLSESTAPAIEAAEEKDYYPLSSAQERIYIAHRMAPDTMLYNIPALFELEGAPDANRLETAFKRLIARHESFRTSFHMIDDQPVQKIHDHVDFRITSGDIKGGHFNLSGAPLLRVMLIKEEADRYLLMIDMHHIISDGFSMEILQRELHALYAGESLPPLRVRYRDYAQWRNSEPRQRRLKKQERYPLHLPLDYPRAPEQSFAGDTEEFVPGGFETAALMQSAKEHRMTPYMLLLGIYSIFLSKLTGQEEIIIASPVDGREHPDPAPVIGMFVNTVVMSSFPSGRKTLQAFFKETRGMVLEVFDNRDYPFEELVKKCPVQREASRNPIFDVMLAYRTVKKEEKTILKRLPYHTKTAKCDMTLTITENEGNLSFSLNYCSALFKAASVRRFVTYLKQLIRAVTESD
ncbi:MAG: AMP-binding protein, partial [bacterium]|nr:AMP-binding protein [bacterium]